MTLAYELYWSFRSPYSYLLTPRLLDLEADYDVRCVVRPVYPLAVRTPEFFDSRDPLWTSYFMTDVFREAQFLGLPLRWPRPDPVQRGADGDYRIPQPYIHRLTQLGVAAAERGRGLQFSGSPRGRHRNRGFDLLVVCFGWRTAACTWRSTLHLGLSALWCR